MIRSFGNKFTQKLWETGQAKGWAHGLRGRALDKLQVLNAAPGPEIMRIPPGNRLEALQGNLQGYYSIRINDQWRIIFRFLGEDAFDVAILDYH